MRETILHLVIITIVAGFVFFANLGEARLWDRDEPRNAGCAAEMLARGDLVVPIFNDQLRQQKPVLLYWLMMSAYSIFGVNEFSARFWSAFLAIGTTLATYGIGRRLYDGTTGLVAAIALGSSLMFVVAARAATPDSVLIFCSTMALFLYVQGTFPIQAGRIFPTDIRFVLGIYLFLGLGVLAKGPVGFLLPMAMIGLFGLIQNRNRRSVDGQVSLSQRVTNGINALWQVCRPDHFFKTLWAMRPLTAAVVILAVAAPWFVLVHIRTEGDFTRLFFLSENIARATQAMESHSGGLWYYPLAILIGFFPWSVFWVPTVIGLWKQGKSADPATPGNTFLMGWVGVQVVAFSIAQTKLPSYVTPCYPALALLTAHCLVTFVRNLEASDSFQRGAASRHWFALAFGSLALSGVAIGVGVWVGLGKYLPSETWLAVLGSIPLVAGTVMCLQLLNNRSQWVLPGMGAAAVLFCLLTFGIGTVAVDQQRQCHLILNPIQSTPNVSVGAYGCLESTWVFYSQKPITELVVLPERQIVSFGQSERRQRPPNRKFWEPTPRRRLDEFVKHEQDALIVTTDEHLNAVKQMLPEHYAVRQSAPYFLKDQTLYLLGPGKREARLAAQQQEPSQR